VRAYALYLVGNQLFEYVEAPDPAAFLTNLAATGAYTAWRARAGPYLEPGSQVALESVFYLE
jgi:L-rhamnose mutarotase